MPAQPGRPRRIDYEYRSSGTCNLFTMVEPLTGWRYVEITDRRTGADFAHQMKWLVDAAYPEATIDASCCTTSTCTPKRRCTLPSHPLRRDGVPESLAHSWEDVAPLLAAGWEGRHLRYAAARRTGA